METLTRTIYGSQLQTSLLLGLPYTPVANSTLNERFNVQKNATLAAGQTPKLQYLAMGVGGTKITSGADGNARAERVQHQATDASCYKPIPFVIREITNDLSVQDRARYALRVQETHNNKQYWAYYLRRIDISDAQVLLETRVVEDGVATSTPFIPTNDNLVPQQPTVSNTGSNLVSNRYVTVSSQLSVIFTEADVAEAINVAKIVLGDEAYALLSELAFCSGVDKVITIEGNVQFTEAIAVQVLSFVNTFHAFQYTQGGINGEYDVGANEPLYQLTPSP